MAQKYGNLFEVPYNNIGTLEKSTSNAAYTAVHTKRELRQCPVKRLDFLLATDASSKGYGGDPTLTTNVSGFNRNDISDTRIAPRESILTFTNETIMESP